MGVGCVWPKQPSYFLIDAIRNKTATKMNIKPENIKLIGKRDKCVFVYATSTKPHQVTITCKKNKNKIRRKRMMKEKKWPTYLCVTTIFESRSYVKLDNKTFFLRAKNKKMEKTDWDWENLFSYIVRSLFFFPFIS